MYKMNIVLTRICEFCRYIFDYEDVQGKEVLESIYNYNIIKTYFYFMNTSNHFSNVGNALHINSYEELCEHKSSITTLFYELCEHIDSNILKETKNVEELLLKLDNYFGFVIEFPNVFDKDGFNWISYLNNNSDLVSVGLIDQSNILKHWFDFGINENRVKNGIIGLQTSRGVLTNKYINSLHVVFNIKKFVGEKINTIKIYDINSEMGINAYYLNKMGVKIITLIQKPEDCLLTSYFLLNILNKDSVTLGNESTDNSVKIIPDNKFLFSDIDSKILCSLVYNESYIERLQNLEFDKNNKIFIITNI